MYANGLARRILIIMTLGIIIDHILIINIQLHATLRMQHVYTVFIYMFTHTYQSKCMCNSFCNYNTTNQNMTHV